MLSVKDLNEIYNDSFDKWFNRWWDKFDPQKKIKHSAMKGYKTLMIAETGEDYIDRRMDDDRFIDKLKEKLPELYIKREIRENSYVNLLGKRITDIKKYVKISWDISTK